MSEQEVFGRRMKQWNELAEVLYDVEMNFTKEEKVEFIQCLRDSKKFSPKIIRAIFEFLDEEAFVEHELFILGKQIMENYLEDKVVDAIKKKYPKDNGFYLYYRGYIQGIRAERARRKKPVFKSCVSLCQRDTRMT